MDDGKIKYSDLISPDDSVKTLVEQLTELNKTYSSVLDVVKTGAKDIVAQLKSMNSASAEGRTEIDEATLAASRLARAQKELKFAMSDTGKEVAWLKSQIVSQNKMSVEMQKQSQALVGSYDKLKAEIKEQVLLWKSLSDTERAGAFGTDLLNSITSMKSRLSDLDSQLKVHVQSMTAVEKAEAKLNFLRSAEGQRLLELKKQINEVISAHKTEKPVIDEVTQAKERLAAAQSATRQAAYEYNIQAREANRVAKLQAQLNLSEAGSYNQLSAQYELNKIALNKMSAAERSGTEAGKQLEAETLALYVQMQKLQEATGNHRLSVGNYAKSWDGLGISVSQVVRELPAAAVSMNTFFLGISNNIPILVDEINKLRAENKQAIAEGKQAKSVIGSVAKALFSWNTLLVIGLTVLSMHGKQIIEWIGSLFNGKKAAIDYADAVDNVNKELEKTNGSYGNNIVTLHRLSEEWKNLTKKKEQLQWIKDNKSEFDKLDVSVRNVTDAENIFVDNTDTMVAALKARAKAAAAMKLAADNYEKALIKEAEAEAEAAKGPSKSDRAKAGIANISTTGTGPAAGANTGVQIQKDAEEQRKQRIQGLKDEAKAAEATADQYFNMATAITKESNAALKAAGIDPAHKLSKDRTRHPRQRDLTDTIWRNDLSIRKKYELSLSELQRDEYQKRRIEAVDQANQTIREMQEKFRKNQNYITNPDGKFKPLTPEQKKQIEEQQKEIGAIIENTKRKLEIDLTNMQYDYEVDRNKKLRQVMKWRLDDIAEDIEKEKKLRIEQLEEQEALYSTKGATKEGQDIVVTGNMTPEQMAEFQRKREQIIAEYDSIILNMKAKSIEAQVNLVKKGSDEELAILLEQNEIARKLALAENKLKPVEQRQSESEINKQFNKSGNLIKGRTTLSNFDEAQAAAEAEFNVVKHNETEITVFKLTAERDRWAKQIKLAKEGALDWSDAQLKEAEAMIKKLNREISEAGSFVNLVGDKGLGGALLTKLGFDDDQISAMTDATNIIIDNIKSIMQAEVDAAEAAVAAAEKRVEAAQSAYDAEVEARNNGYANNVATAKKELQQEKKNQAQKQKLLEEAKRRQEAVDTAIQISSLVTASANLWSSFSKLGPAGPALAAAAIAAMWTSFTVAKVRAAQVASAPSEEYGEGGFEILEGGSHASGNDIDLQTKNSRGRNMRAEGGEAMAIINRHSTRKYRKMLPGLVNSINKGTFEDKFIGAFKSGDELAQSVTYNQPNIDLSQLEEDVRALKKNSERQYYAMPDGSYIETKSNVVRHIK